MPDFQTLVQKYERRRRDTVVDAVTTGLAYADNVAVDLGLMEDSGVLDAVTVAAPFAVIAVTEQLQVILGRKTGKAGLSDGVQRMLKTGAAMGVGALAAAAAGAVAAVPAAMGTRILLKHYQSKSLLGLRVQDRIARLRALEERRTVPLNDAQLPALPPGVDYVRDED